MAKWKKKKRRNKGAAALASPPMTTGKKIKKELWRKKRNGGVAPLAPVPEVSAPPPESYAPAPPPSTPGEKVKKKSQRSMSNGGAAPPDTANPARAGVQDSQNEGDSVEGVSGFIFLCTGKTKPECYRNRVFGLAKKKMKVVERIRPGAVLFLFDVELRILYGVYQAISNGGVNLVPEAFGGGFPAQVKFKIDKDCFPIPESAFKPAIQKNYKKSRIRLELDSQQVDKLLSLFQPATLSQQPPTPITLPQQSLPPVTMTLQPPLQQTVEDQHHPPPSPFPPPEDPYRSGRTTCIPPPCVNPRYAPQTVPPPANEPYVPTAHYTWTPSEVYLRNVPATGVLPPNDPYYPAPPTNPCCQRESMRISYPENPIDYERAGYRFVLEKIPRDQLPAPARDYQPRTSRERGESVPLVSRPCSCGGAPMEVHLQHSYWMTGHEDPNLMCADSTKRPVPLPPHYPYSGAPPAHH